MGHRKQSIILFILLLGVAMSLVYLYVHIKGDKCGSTSRSLLPVPVCVGSGWGD